MKAELAKYYFIRLFIGALPLCFFAVSMFAKGESGNSGMSLNMTKFLPVILLFIWGCFLIIEGLNHFIKSRMLYGFSSIASAVILGMVFFLIMYLEHIS